MCGALRPEIPKLRMVLTLQVEHVAGMELKSDKCENVKIEK